MALIHSLHEYKEFNLNKINESLVWFGTEMGTRSRIKARNWRKTSASYRYVQISELYHLHQFALIHSLHEYKEFNLNKINESLEWFGTEMGTRSRNKIRNWSKTSASYRYVQISELYHLLQLALIHSLHEYKEFNLNKINESLEWFGTKWALEAESKPEIEGKHLHHKDMSN